MSVERYTIWKCDRCGTSQSVRVLTVGSPDGWVGIAVNVDAADGAWDHDGWKRHHLCPQCGPLAGIVDRKVAS